MQVLFLALFQPKLFTELSINHFGRPQTAHSRQINYPSNKRSRFHMQVSRLMRRCPTPSPSIIMAFPTATSLGSSEMEEEDQGNISPQLLSGWQMAATPCMGKWFTSPWFVEKEKKRKPQGNYCTTKKNPVGLGELVSWSTLRVQPI